VDCEQLNSREHHETSKLNQQKPQMPFPWFHVPWLYLAETQEEHCEEKDGLYPFAGGQKESTGRVNCRNLPVYEIQTDAGRHSDNKHPVFQYF